MAMSRGLLVAVGLLMLAVGILGGFLIGYFTQVDRCEEDGSDDAREDAKSLPVHVYNHAPGPCQLVEGIEDGSEDMVLLPSGRVLITSGIVSGVVTGRPDPKGRVLLVDMSDISLGGVEVPITNEEHFDYGHFNPHGISLWNDEDTGHIFVFIINHGNPFLTEMVENVEKFEFSEARTELTHLLSIHDYDSMLMLNNLIATGPDTFYFTNFVSSRSLKEVIEQLDDNQPSGSIGCYDGQKGQIVVGGLITPNGINISPDGRYVYVALYGEGKFSTYKRDLPSNRLSLHKTYPLYSRPDNIDVQGQSVLIGSHPDAARLGEYLVAPLTALAPSQVLRLTVEDGEVTDSAEVYMNNGTQFSGVSVAIHWQDKLLLGSINTKALYCEVKYMD